MSKENIQIPPRPKLFQWYHHVIPGKYEQWNIWIVKKRTVLWGITYIPESKVVINNTNLRYWDEKDFPWEESLDKGEKTVESECPDLSNKDKLEIFKLVFNEVEESHWLYK